MATGLILLVSVFLNQALTWTNHGRISLDALGYQLIPTIKIICFSVRISMFYLLKSGAKIIVYFEYTNFF